MVLKSFSFHLPVLQYGPMHGPGGGWHFMPFGGLGWLIIIGLAIVFIVFLVRRGQAPSRPSAHHDRETALDVLKKRYARGEITREEFTAMKEDLDKP